MLSPKTIEIVKSTAPVLEVKGTEITRYFYEKLFERHPELLNIFNHANQKKGRQQTALANTVYAAAKHIDQLEMLLPAVKQIAHKHRSLGIKPEHYPIVGEHLLLAIKEVLGDAATDEIINAWGEAYGVIAKVFIDVEEGMYAEAESEVNGWRGFKEFKVIKKVKESSKITSFYFQPTDGAGVPTYLPGQYISIRISIPGEENLHNRQYSLSTAPGKDYFRISVKKEDDNKPEGKVSTYLHDHVEPGDVIEVSAPAGDFTLDVSKPSNVTLISGGVGITPLFSMLEGIAEANPVRKVTFIHGSKNEEVLTFSEQVEKNIEKLENGESYLYLDKETNAPCYHKGYMAAENLSPIVDKDSQFYICGPAPFMTNVIKSLMKIGVKEEQIHYEFFGPAMKLDVAEAVEV
jgi:nitric oxide dioxygenase